MALEQFFEKGNEAREDMPNCQQGSGKYRPGKHRVLYGLTQSAAKAYAECCVRLRRTLRWPSQNAAFFALKGNITYN